MVFKYSDSFLQLWILCETSTLRAYLRWKENEVVAKNNYEHDKQMSFFSFSLSSGGHVFLNTAIIPFVFHPYIRGLAVAPTSQTLPSTSVSVGAQFMLLGIHHTPCNLACIHLNSTAWWITRTMIMIDPGKRTWRITFEFEPRRTVRWNVYELKEKNSLYSRRLPHRQEREETHYFFTWLLSFHLQ